MVGAEAREWCSAPAPYRQADSPEAELLRPNGFETLAIRVWSATGEGFYTRASVASLALVAVSIVPLLALTYRDLSD